MSPPDAADTKAKKHEPTFSPQDAEQITRTRDALVDEIVSRGLMPVEETYVRAACNALRRVVEHGENIDFTEEALLTIAIQAMSDKHDGKLGDHRLSKEIARFVGDGRLKCDRNRVYTLRRKYGLERKYPPGEGPPVKVSPPTREELATRPTRPAATQAAQTGIPPLFTTTATPPVSTVPAAADQLGAVPENELKVGDDTVRTLLDDPFYVQRDADTIVKALAGQSGQTVVLRGPPGYGKTDVLSHYLARCRNHHKQIALVDLSTIVRQGQEYSEFLRLLARDILHELGLGTQPQMQINISQDLTFFMEDEILTRVQGPLVLAFDRADRLQPYLFKNDFFYLLRTWHSERTRFRPHNVWRLSELIMVTSVSGERLIDDPHRSPFNVGVEVVLDPFIEDDYDKLVDVLLEDKKNKKLSAKERANLPVSDLFRLLGGHPAMTRTAFMWLQGPLSASRENMRDKFDALIKTAAEEDGPFRAHLSQLRHLLHRTENAAETFCGAARCWRQDREAGRDYDPSVLEQELTPNEQQAVIDAGLVLSVPGGHTPACELFVDYFAK